MKLLIVEEALRDLKAHWFDYIKTIKQAANKHGWVVEIAAHEDVAPEILCELNCFPLFKNARYLNQESGKLPGERYYGFLLHSYRCLKVLWPFLKRNSYDAIFVPTVLVHHLLAWYVVILFCNKKVGHLTLFFVTTPGIWNSKHKTTCFPKSSIVLRKLLKMFKPFVNAGKVTFAVEAGKAKSQFETLTNLPFKLMPHPVPFRDIDVKNSRVSLDDVVSSYTSQRLLSFGCFGFARHEKGSDLLKEAMEKILNDSSDFKGRFTIQWTDPFTMPDGSVCTPGFFLENHPQVIIIDKPLMSSEYEEFLLQTDCIILPYRNTSYHARVSRIAIEAACNGIPIIYTIGGWLEENVKNFGAGIGIMDESTEQLVTAIQTFCFDFESFSRKAKDRINKAREYYSPERFSQILLGACNHCEFKEPSDNN